MSRCQDCKSKSQSSFCDTCGQKNYPENITTWTMIKEWIEDQFGVDGKVWSTYKKLITSPGTLTLDYINNHRTRYVRPTRILIFTLVVPFLIAAIFNVIFIQFKFLKDDQYIVKNIGFYIIEECEMDTETIDVYLSDLSPRIKKEFFNLWTEKDRDHPKVKKLYEKIHRNGLNIALNQCYVNSQLTTNALSLLWITIPFLSILLGLIYRSKKVLFYHHFIHSIHLHSALFIISSFLLFISAVAINLGLSEVIFNLGYLSTVTFLFLIYLVKSCYKVYQNSNTKNIFKGTSITLVYIPFCFFFLFNLWALSFMGGFSFLDVVFSDIDITGYWDWKFMFNFKVIK